jgi:hypothetical protein
MTDDQKAALYAVPDGIAGWFGARVSSYNKTPRTKIIENAVQGAAVTAVAIPLFPFSLIVAIPVVLVKAKNIYGWASGKSD